LPGALNTISNAYATGDVAGGGGSSIGGFVGGATATDLSFDFATGAEIQTAPGQNGGADAVGGFAGAIGNGSAVSDSFASGDVTSLGTGAEPAEAGGFVGVFQDSTLNQAYATGAVGTTGAAFTGGFAGLAQSDALIDQVYAIGPVSATSGPVGGLIGQVGNASVANDTTLVNDSYWDEAATGQTTGYTLAGTGSATGVVGIGGSTGIDPFAQATYVGWDFTSTWSPPSSGFYPELYGVSHVIGIFAGSTSTVYGTAPNLTFSFIGEQDFDNSFAFTAPTLNIVGQQLSTGGLTDAGAYSVIGSGASAADSFGAYRIVYLPGSLTVTPFALTAALAGPVEKTYDGTTTATLTGGEVQLLGALAGDLVSVAGGSGTYDTKNVGTDKAVTITGLTLTGADAANYTISPSTTADVGVINPATLTATLIGATSKVYDATTTATLTSANFTLSGVISGDSVSLAAPASGVYDTKDVGTGKTVTAFGLTLTGADAEDYTVANTAAGAIGTIAPASLTAILSGPVAKTYDGTTVATLSTSEFQLDGAFAGDSLGIAASGVYDTKNAGTGKTVSATGITLTGADADDYTLTKSSASAAVGIINPAPLTVGLAGTVQKTFNGTTAATLAADNYTLTGGAILSGDSVNFVFPTSCLYDTAAIGTGKTVSVTGIALSGADADDYAVNGAASGPVGVIVAAPQNVINAATEQFFLSSTNSTLQQPLTIQFQVVTDTWFNIDIFPLSDDDQDRTDPRDASPLTGAGNGDLWPGSDLDPETKP
jgi:hypothetical protein